MLTFHFVRSSSISWKLTNKVIKIIINSSRSRFRSSWTLSSTIKPHTSLSSLLLRPISTTTYQQQKDSIRSMPSPPTSESKDESFMNNLTNKRDERLIWIDLEMTGLDVENERILEIACLVSEGDLSFVAEGPSLIIHQDDSVLDQMGEWCVKHHGQSGLTDLVKKSKITTEDAETMVLKFLQEHTPRGKCPLAGNSVGTDKQFIDRYMPKLSHHLHYRIVDVSTVKELCRRWYPMEFKTAPAKKLTHRALDDIKESIEELKYYRSSVFK